MNYFEIDFTLNPLLPAREVLVAELAELGFESFLETDEGVKAYIQEADFTEDILQNLMTTDIPEQSISFEKKLIMDQNWNAEWEKNFEPIIVDDACLIRAPFHHDLPRFKYEILIEPKMSFGTGHHATTHLIISEMITMDFTDKSVLDMGCGTGVLAILAEMLKAKKIDAIDIDEWAFENTVENIERNHCRRINVLQGGAETIPQDAHYDIILANINRNILTRDMHSYANVLKPKGEILFSGFYLMDQPEIARAANALGLRQTEQKTRGEWCMLKFIKD
jgi:ribosomal protein L11 methyltransferase